MLPLGKQTRRYGTVGRDDPAEFRIRKNAKDNTTML
jgi:hypothetical protein